MDRAMARLGDGGRLVIPAAFRHVMGVAPGDELILVLEDGCLHILTPDQAVHRAQSLVRTFIPEGTPLVEELIAERRDEAADG